jgi:acyl-CoA thioester hydrolase
LILQHHTFIRVRYSETDQMGFVYYGNYAAYFEVARVEALRSLGISYKSLEEGGVLMPVKNFEIDYLKPAKYDEMIEIVTTIKETPKSGILFEYESLNEKKEVINRAKTTLVFLDAARMRPIRVPQLIIEALHLHTDKNGQ